jgi:uncharacterized protein
MRRAAVAASVVALVLLAGLAGGGWYYADQLLPAEIAGDVVGHVQVVDIDGERITLLTSESTPSWMRDDLHADHLVGFAHTSGYLHVFGPGAENGDSVTRDFAVVSGRLPTVGDRGDLQVSAYPANAMVLGLDVDRVTASGPLGDLPGWRFRAAGPDADRWVVFVHGRGGSRAEPLRAVDIVVRETGRSALVVTYRNSPNAPESPDGYGHFGDSEWEDLQAWLAWLRRAENPRDVVLYGFSQGGSVAAACLDRCEDTSRVSALVLDSPLVSMHDTLVLQAQGRGIPGPVIGPLLASTKLVAGLRGGPDFGNLEHIDRLVDSGLPILAFHGTEDNTVPFHPTQELADEAPDRVTLVSYDGGHVRGWNIDRDRYAAAVRAFLARN